MKVASCDKQVAHNHAPTSAAVHCSRPFASALQFNLLFFLPYLLGTYLSDPMPTKRSMYLLAKSLPVATCAPAAASG